MKIKLLTFNIQHCRNFITKEIDIEGVINLIKETKADIIGLNEVYGKYENYQPQYETIAKALGYYFYFGQTFIYRGIPFGNALISKYKLKDPQTIMIPDPPIRDSHWYETRCLIFSGFEDIDLNVIVTHYGLFDSEQENALATTINTIKNVNNNLVFMGDLNMEPDNEKIKSLKSFLIDTLPINEPTYPSIDPKKKIDYIFISKDLKLLDAKVIKKVVSDHFPHFAEIKIEK